MGNGQKMWNFMQAKKNIIIVRLARSNIREENQHGNIKSAEGKFVFRLLFPVCLTHQISIVPHLKGYCPRICSLWWAVLEIFWMFHLYFLWGDGVGGLGQKVPHLKFLENWRSHSTSDSWRVNAHCSAVRLSIKSLSHFQHIGPKKGRAIIKYKLNSLTQTHGCIFPSMQMFFDEQLSWYFPWQNLS